MKKEDYLKQIEKESRNRTNILESVGGILKRGLDFGKKHILPVALALVLNISAFLFVGCGEKQEIVNPGPGLEQGGGEDSGKNPETDDQGKDETGKDDPSNPGGSTEDPDKDDPNKPGESTDDPGKEEPGENESGTEKPGTDDPNNPGGSDDPVDDPIEEPDISNLVVYVDEEGQSHVNMPVLQEAALDYLHTTKVLNISLYDTFCQITCDDILFTNYSPSTSKVTFFGKGKSRANSNDGYFTITLSLDLGTTELTIDGLKEKMTKLNGNTIKGNSIISEIDSFNLNNENSDESTKFLNSLVSILDYDGTVNKEDVRFITVSNITENSGNYGFGYGRNIIGYALEKSGDELVLKNYSIYSSSQSGELVEGYNKYISNILNFEDHVEHDEPTYVVVQGCIEHDLGVVEGYYYNDDVGLSLTVDGKIVNEEEVQLEAKNLAQLPKKKEIELSL